MLDMSKTYASNNYGDFRISKYNNPRDVIIEFVATGYKVSVMDSKIILGAVKDRLLPTVHGVGFIGDGSYKSRGEGVTAKQYQSWTDMLKRCYSMSELKRRPTYNGCSVCEEWHNFQNFAKWFDDNYIEGCQLDKDVKVEGNKIYSPSTCKFIPISANVIKARAKEFSFVSPKGIVTNIYNLSVFCRKEDLNRGCMSSVHAGRLPHHKGWTSF